MGINEVEDTVPEALTAGQWMRAKAVEMILQAHKGAHTIDDREVGYLLRGPVSTVYKFIRNEEVPRPR
jgi:hypothetical protein